MFLLVFLTALVACVVGGLPRSFPIVPMLDGKIVGGAYTTIEDHPHQLSLQYFGKHFCGASILSATVVLTAAHCTDGINAKFLSVRAGTSRRGFGGVKIDVEEVIQHPKYNPRNVDYDIAVLKLASPLQFGNGIQPIRVHGRNEELDDGTSCTVTGWGTRSSGGTSPITLQEVDVKRVNDATCKAAYGSDAITQRMTCYGHDQGGKDSCQGDSGGPLVFGDVQVGIVSWGRGCALPGYPGVYTKVSNPEVNQHILENL